MNLNIGKNKFDISKIQFGTPYPYVGIKDIQAVAMFNTKEEAIKYIQYKNTHPIFSTHCDGEWIGGEKSNE